MTPTAGILRRKAPRRAERVGWGSITSSIGHIERTPGPGSCRLITCVLDVGLADEVGEVCCGRGGDRGGGDASAEGFQDGGHLVNGVPGGGARRAEQGGEGSVLGLPAGG